MGVKRRGGKRKELDPFVKKLLKQGFKPEQLKFKVSPAPSTKGEVMVVEQQPKKRKKRVEEWDIDMPAQEEFEEMVDWWE